MLDLKKRVEEGLKDKETRMKEYHTHLNRMERYYTLRSILRTLVKGTIAVVLVFLILALFGSITQKKNNITRILVELAMEQAYYEGQCDALRGDIRVDTLHKKWIKSPWNNDSTYSYDPKQSALENVNRVTSDKDFVRNVIK